MKSQSATVMFVLPSFAGGGAERVALTLMRFLDRKRFVPSLTVFDAKGPLQKLVSENADLTVLDRPRLRSAWSALISEIRVQRPDFVFSTLGYVNLALLAARPILPRNTRIVVREANMPSLSLSGTSYPTLHRIAYRWLYPRADGVICTSTQMQVEMSDDFGVPPSRLFLLSNPVDEESIRRAAEPMKRFAGEGLRLVAAGRLTHQKGFDRLINMMVDVAAQTHLTILGEGPDRKALEAQVRALGLIDKVHFAGFCENPWAYYAGADGVLVPSRWEGLPNVVLEALCCGAPVISTPEAGGVADVAATAGPGAVAMESAGPGFVDAINNLTPQFKPDLSLRPSLLPSLNKAKTAAGIFGDILQTMGHSLPEQA